MLVGYLEEESLNCLWTWRALNLDHHLKGDSMVLTGGQKVPHSPPSFFLFLNKITSSAASLGEAAVSSCLQGQACVSQMNSKFCHNKKGG